MAGVDRSTAQAWSPIARSPVAWTLLVGLALIKLGVHVLSSVVTYGYMTDELYYLDCANHLAWGYVDHPPLSIALLALLRLTIGDSLIALRLAPALAGSATIVLVGLMARELGGGRVTQGFAALAALVAPVYFGIDAFYSMNAFEPALWALAAYLLLRLENGATPRLWLPMRGLRH
jgi:4-amino-4-deoxy-L-arabinose transferase-like glycosyltransferase